jgi:hypothetical protein
MAALAVALRAVGADVRVCAAPDAVARATAGCDFVVAAARSHVAAHSMARKRGIPHGCVIFSPNALDEPDVAHIRGERVWLAADPTLGPCPPAAGVDVVSTGVWLRADDRPLPGELAAFCDAGEAPVYVRLGAVPAELARAAVDAIRARGRRVVRAGAAIVPSPADDCFVVADVNQRALLGRVAAVVHDGTAATTTAAARAGVAQVIVSPPSGDRAYWAGRIEALGIGAGVGIGAGSSADGPAPTTASVSAALDITLGRRTRARASALAGRIRADGATIAAQSLLETARRERPRMSDCSPADRRSAKRRPANVGASGERLHPLPRSLR